MPIRTSFIAAAVAAATLSGTIALAQEGPPPEQRMQRVFDQLDLSDAQRTQLRTLADSHRTATEKLREQVRTARQTLDSAKPGDANYDAVTAEARRSLEAARSQLREQQEQFRTQTDAILTPEQRSKMQELRAEQRQRMGERRRGMGDAGRQGPGDRRPRQR
jgi:Spy/CpxP family protein refolding chaperone